MQPIDDFENVILDVVHKLKNNPKCTVFFLAVILILNTFFALTNRIFFRGVYSIPGISDHNIILADMDLKPLINKNPRKVHLRCLKTTP